MREVGDGIFERQQVGATDQWVSVWEKVCIREDTQNGTMSGTVSTACEALATLRTFGM